MTYTSRGLSFRLSSNNTPLSPPLFFCSKIKAVPEEKYNEKLPVDSSISPWIIYDDFKIGEMSCGNFSMNNHTISLKNKFDSNNVDVSSGYDFLNSHTLYQFEDSSYFKEMGFYV